MKAAQFYGTKNVQINQIPSPVSRRGMVTIDVAWCGTCGSDLHEYLEGPIFIPAVGHPHLATHEQIPVTVRHEFSGTVSAEGEGVTDLVVGDHVVVEPYFVCGVCAPCKQRRYNLCTSVGFIGLAGGGSGLSEEVVVYRRWVHPRRRYSPRPRAALIEPLSTAYHAFQRSGAKAGDTALPAALARSACCCVVPSRPKT